MKFLSFGILVLILNGVFYGPHHVHPYYGGSTAPVVIQDVTPVDTFIKLYINQTDEAKAIKLKGNKVIVTKGLARLYKQLNYQPVWDNIKNRQDLVNILQAAYFEGLNPKDYHIDFIQDYNTTLTTVKKKNAMHKAMADILMTDAILSYTHHLIHGKVHSENLDLNWNYSKPCTPDDIEFKLLTRLTTQSLKPGIDSIRSDLPIYSKLKQLFAKYDSLHKAGGKLPEIRYPGKSLQKGDSISEVGLLKQRLIADSYLLTLEDHLFDEELELALMDFQSLNGLKADGIAGKKTYKALNISLEDRLDILRVNMERVRWLNNKSPDTYILVNIASFNLQLIKQKQKKFQCKVVVGKQHHQTPVFTSSIKYVVFNPIWYIPKSIITNEILPLLKQDSLYLPNRNMTLLQNAEVIDPSTVDFSIYTTNNFPFSIRREPGPDNDLGLVKFLFPNKYAVYLHDTPSKSLFSRTERAFSHGCIRVEKPFLLAQYLLGNQGYNQDVIKEILAKQETQTVYLNEEMPIMIIYMTCHDNKDNNKISFYNDIYGLDEKLLHLLKKSK